MKKTLSNPWSAWTPAGATAATSTGIAQAGRARRTRVIARRATAALICAWATAASAVDWVGDFDALLSGLARNYANFEYSLTERRMDLPALATREREALLAAADDVQRRAAIERVLRAFGDPHLKVKWTPDPEGDPPACRNYRPSPGVAFHRLPGFESLPSAEARQFGAGILRGKPALGVIRIGLFIERAFDSACEQAASQLGITPGAPCDSACSDRLDKSTARLLNHALAATVHELESAGAERLVIDITNNGGGSDWSELVARLLAGPLQSAPVAMLRHPSWIAQLQHLKAEIRTLKSSADSSDSARLRSAELLIDSALPKLAESCDLSRAWTDRDLAMGERELPCSTLVKGTLFAPGLEASRPAGASSPVDALMFRPAWYGRFVTGVAKRPLLVLVNQETHSSAEQFAALLRDNRRARIVGVPSAGAACGTYTDAGTAFVLPSSGARVLPPDCVRLRRDGTNERDGLIPDLIVPWSRSDTAWQVARKAAAALQTSTFEQRDRPRRPAMSAGLPGAAAGGDSKY